MKKIQKSILILSTIFFILGFFSYTALAWEDCPFGYEDEPYPGTCWRYVDENNDGICDLSQEEPVEESQNKNTQSSNSYQQQNSTRFPFMLIISLIIVYILIVALRYFVSKKKLTNTKVKIILNILLMITFIPSAITGVVLLLATNIGILREIGQIFTQIHNISSLFFMWISVYHIIWHIKYYKKGIKGLFKTK